MSIKDTLQWWDWNIDEYNKRIDECDAETGNYLSDMMDAISRYFKLEPAFLDEILDICKQPEVMELPHRRRREAVNGLRRMFASISLDRLKPDLVIMDEFQRFKDLIAGDNSESGMLARKFLIEDNDVKVLLLSATPYKPYSTLEELSETGEGHYQEFMQVMDFLMNDDQKKHQFHQVWSDYSRHLAEIKTEHYTVLVAEKTRAEDEMYRCVCRTERLSDAIFDRSKATEMTEITTEDTADSMWLSLQPASVSPRPASRRKKTSREICKIGYPTSIRSGERMKKRSCCAKSEKDISNEDQSILVQHRMLLGMWSHPVLRKRIWMRNISGSARAMTRPLMNGQWIATIGDGSCVRFAAELSRMRRCPITVAREVQTGESVPIVHEMVVANPHSWLDIIRMMVYY